MAPYEGVVRFSYDRLIMTLRAIKAHIGFKRYPSCTNLALTLIDKETSPIIQWDSM